MGLVHDAAHNKIADAVEDPADQEHGGHRPCADQSGVGVVLQQERSRDLVKDAAAARADAVGDLIEQRYFLLLVVHR